MRTYAIEIAKLNGQLADLGNMEFLCILIVM